MRITKASFTASLEQLKKYPGMGKPEIALAGRSNVGKSSLINSLTRNGHLAHTSSEPGKTRMINIYSINDEFVIADLPGYGFAKASGDERRRWAGMIEGYLSGSENLRYVLLLVDVRHEPTDEDRQMAEYLRHYGIPFSVIATKADKLSKLQISKNLPAIYRKLIVQPWQVRVYSSETGAGRDDVLKLLDEVLHPAPVQDDGIIIPEDLSFEDGPTWEEEI